MAVYFQPQGKSWLDYVAPIAQQALGGLVQGMFERDSNARNLKIEERKAAEASARKQQEEAIRQQRAQEYLNSLSEITPRERDAYGLALFSPETAPFIDKISQQFNPHKTLVQQDLGNKMMSGGFDPSTGEIYNKVYEQIGLSPKEIEITRRDAMKEKAANYRANVTANQSRFTGAPFVSADGQTYLVDQKNGMVPVDGVKGVPRVNETTEEKQRTVANVLKRMELLKDFLGDVPPERQAEFAMLDEEYKRLMGFGVGTDARQIVTPTQTAPMDEKTAGLIQYLKDKGYSDEDIQKALAAR
ncbi:hypothetical protein FACS1894204_06100 [Synergistales bacterium]|nr:hypothetical protein FACS1894204_06100 [Synergistales bacterium]